MRTRLAYGAGAGALIIGVATGPLWSPAATIPASIACAILLLFVIAGAPLRRWLPLGVGIAGAISLLTTLWIYYAMNAGARMSIMLSIAVLFELAGLIWLLILLVRHASGPAIWLASAFAIPAQLAMFFRGFQETSTQLGAFGGFLFWSIGSMAAVLGGLYLRGMDRSRAQAVRNAQQAQRMDLARDLHDYVAHDISGIVVLAQAAQVVAEQNPEAVLDSLRRIEQAGQQSLTTMDRTVRMLRDPNAPEPTLGIDELPTLVDRFAESGSVGATLTVPDGLAAQLPHELSATLYRVTVEGLTNVRRHAPNSDSVMISLHRENVPAKGAAEEVVLRVRNHLGSGRNDGVPSVRAAALADRHGGGLGLAGLTERVETLGGRLTAGPDQAGWTLTVRLPLPGTS